MNLRPLVSGSKAVLSHHGAALVAAAFGLVHFINIAGARLLDPTWAGWLTASDGLGHLFGWLFYRIEPWHLPLGSMRGLLYPYGTTVGLTDSIPWVAVLCKLASPMLPPTFQFFGLWLGLCFALQGYVAAKIVKLASPSKLHQALGGALFTLSAPLVLRVGHEALCAHWMLLVCIWLHLKPYGSARTARRAILHMIALNVLAAGIHPYLEVMVLALAFALYARLRLANLLSVGRASVAAVLTAGTATAVFYLFGYLGGDANPGSPGFGDFSADLATFVNPAGYSRFFDALPSGSRQYEGMAYVGAGVVGLTIFGTGAALREARIVRRWKHVPIVVVCVALAVFALANPITWLGKPVLRLDFVYRSYAWLTGPFRSSGRFIWPLFYLVLTYAVVVTVRSFRRRPHLASMVLALVVWVQARELRVDSAREYLSKAWAPSSNPAWTLLSGTYEHMALYPPMVSGIRGVPFDEPRVAKLGYVAFSAKMTLNSGYTSRMSSGSIAYAQQWATMPEATNLQPDTVYVADVDVRPTLERAGGRCGSIDSLLVCVRADRKTAFSDYLDAHP
jgi:hypothetical protein